MADDALEYVEDENFLPSKGNRKMDVIGNGDQLTNLANTYPGQEIFCTADGGAFIANTSYIRNAANDTWIVKRSPHTESETTPIDSETGDTTATSLLGHYFTFPTTSEFFIITKMTWKNGTIIGSNVAGGVWAVRENLPLTNDPTPLIAYIPEVAQAGTSSLQSQAVVTSRIVPKGTHVFYAVILSSTTGRLRYKTITSQLSRRNEPYASVLTPATVLDRAHINNTVRPYVTISYKEWP